MVRPEHSYSAFGLPIASEFPLPGLRPGAGDGAVLELRRATALPEAGELTRVWASRFPGGVVVTADVAPDGRQRLSYGERASFEISPAADAVSCVLDVEDDPGALRFLLDTVLWWTCLSRGSELIHASAVELPAGVYGIAGRTGGGKTSLAVALMRRGHQLFSDDVLVVRREEGALIAQPGPPLMNLPLAAGDVSDIGTPLATFDDQEETWVAVHRSSSAPASVAGIFLLDRAAGLELGVKRIEATVLDLIPHIWGLPHAEETPKDRFEAISDIAGATAVFQISAGLDVPPASLAALVEDAARDRNAGGERVRA
jgi:hypothetical protein